MTHGIENETQPDFRKLAAQYASFFTALGGICITVLTLILALDRDPIRADLHSALVASLSVAILISFIGAHLMAEMAASIRQPAASGKTPSPSLPAQSPYPDKETPPWAGGRLFLLASINIYLGVILTSLSLMLLPAAYNKRNARDITVITLSAFLVVLFSAYYWMKRYFISRIRPLGSEGESPKPSRKQKTFVIAVSLAVSAAIFFPLTRKYAQAIEFIILIGLSAGSGFYFNHIYHKRPQETQEEQREKLQAEQRERDWKLVSTVFYAAITFSCITIFALGLSLILPSFLSW
jgi:uncharacterized membrane-anchored protein